MTVRHPRATMASLALTSALLMAAAAPSTPASPPTRTFHQQTLWSSGTDGGSCFRLPAITRSAADTLLAFASRRKGSCDDSATADIVMKRSTDDGRTWSGSGTVVSEPRPNAGSFDFSSVVAHSSGPIVLITTSQPSSSDGRPRTPWMRTSTDDGKTWSDPVDLTEEIKAPSGADDWFATGPGHGIELQRGPHQGRLVIPLTYKTEGSSTTPEQQGVRMVYSDDAGKTWHIGASLLYPKDELTLVEPTIAENERGDILMVARKGVDDPFESTAGQAQAISLDSGETFADPGFETSAITAPSIHVSLLRQRYGDSDGYSRLMLSGPARPKTDNNAQGMFVRSSFDDGDTWTAWDGSASPGGIEIDTDHAGYSDMVNTRRGIGVLYEAGVVRFRDEIRYTWFWESALGLPDRP